ncbi:MAG: hypothetical protein Q7R99_00755 [bacterium]|nr:hypothetical protein [bacterium]
MKIGFIIERNVYFRTFGPVIEEAIKKGHQVFCLHNYSQPRGGSKGYQFPDISQTPKFKNGQVIPLDYKTEDDLIKKVLESNIQAVVSLDFFAIYLLTRNRLKEKGVFWVALQSGFDSLAACSEFLKCPDKFFIFSRNGFWVTDQAALPSRSVIKKELGIPEDKKVVLLFPFPFGSSKKTFWTRYIYGTRFFSKENDFEVTKAIKEFCLKNNGFLLVKSRKKEPTKRYLSKVADKILFDEEFYPSTTLKCFAIADIFFSFYSTGVMESAIMGVSNVCISPDEKDWVDLQNPLFKAISEEKKLFHWPGVSYKQTVMEIIKNLPQKKISDFPFNKQEQIKYLQKFANGKVENIAENIVLEIEKMIKKE